MRETTRAVVETMLIGVPVSLLKKDKAPKEPKPKEPKRAVLSPEEKQVLAEQTARYRDAFHSEGYDFAVECAYDPRTLMSPRFEDFDHRRVHALSTPPVGRCVNIAVGETDGRIYATWMFLAPMTVGERIVDRMVQVVGIYVGSAAPPGYVVDGAVYSLDPTFDPLFTPDAVAVVSASTLSGGMWLEHGWLLTDFPVVQPDVNIAVAGWRHLSEVLDVIEPALRVKGCDFGVYRDPVDALTEIFPDLRRSLLI